MAFNDPEKSWRKLDDGTQKPVTEVHLALELLLCGLKGSVENTLYLRASEGAEAYIERLFLHRDYGDPTRQRFAIGQELIRQLREKGYVKEKPRWGGTERFELVLTDAGAAAYRAEENSREARRALETAQTDPPPPMKT